jgi:hypothetical protein
MRQWFVCGICWNVILAHQKSIAATAGLHDWWKRAITPTLPHLRLEETEPVYLSAFARASKTKKQGAETLSILDFSVSDTSRIAPAPLFHIEQKTGPGSIERMSEFQLDVNDFNDIAGAVNNTGLPAYVVHVQATQEYVFPTRRAVVRDLWWSDFFTLMAHKKRVAARRHEDKKAVYFDPSAFKPIDIFIEELKSENYKKVAAKLAKKRITLL